jgi:hypothetical protein
MQLQLSVSPPPGVPFLQSKTFSSFTLLAVSRSPLAYGLAEQQQRHKTFEQYRISRTSSWPKDGEGFKSTAEWRRGLVGSFSIHPSMDTKFHPAAEDSAAVDR